jgi:hypothetical protein
MNCVSLVVAVKPRSANTRNPSYSETSRKSKGSDSTGMHNEITPPSSRLGGSHRKSRLRRALKSKDQISGPAPQADRERARRLLGKWHVEPGQIWEIGPPRVGTMPRAMPLRSRVSCNTTSVISIWRKKLCSPYSIPSGQKCYLCLRYILLPMCPGRT